MWLLLDKFQFCRLCLARTKRFWTMKTRIWQAVSVAKSIIICAFRSVDTQSMPMPFVEFYINYNYKWSSAVEFVIRLQLQSNSTCDITFAKLKLISPLKLTVVLLPSRLYVTSSLDLIIKLLHTIFVLIIILRWNRKKKLIDFNAPGTYHFI